VCRRQNRKSLPLICAMICTNTFWLPLTL
jgi:hypothetical protein